MKDARKILIFSLFFTVLISSSAFAQGFSIEGIIEQLTGVLFIIGFLILLALVAGWRPPRVSGTKYIPLAIFLVVVILIFILPQFVPYPDYSQVPEEFKRAEIKGISKDILVMLGLPEEWMYIPAILYLFILPFAGIYALTWAFLASLPIFRGLPNISRINRLLAFIITFLTIPLGWFTKIVWVLFGFMGAWSVILFGAIFIVGILFRGYGVVESEYSLAARLADQVRIIREFEGYANSRIMQIGDENLRAGAERIRNDIIDQIRRGNITTLEEARNQFDRQLNEFLSRTRQ